ncbi:MAG: hypothetical protein IT357_15885 [Gemmatimonadaceae bacterium]|nr:hypothetical protein [Gemmatimonadaceae bacterium]
MSTTSFDSDHPVGRGPARRWSFAHTALVAVTLLSALAAVLWPSRARAQGVVVSPPTLLIDHRVRSGALELFNPGDRAIEVRIEMLFGYPVTDSSGQFGLETPATPPAGMRAATGWVEAFPARLTIPAAGRQTVRFLARPPATLGDGEHFTRLAITSKFAAAAAGDADAAAIRTEFSVEVRAVTTLLYRKGTVSSSVAVANANTSVRNDTLDVRVDLAPGGNAAFLGTVTYMLENTAGAAVATLDQPVSVYVPVRPRAKLSLADVAPGEYRLRIRARAERADLPAGVILPTPAAELVVPVRIAPR